MPEDADKWALPGYDDLVAELRDCLNQITDKNVDKTLLNAWLKERRREFAIETGQIEGLYTLKRGVTEQLITEGLHHVSGAHTVENINDKTIKGLLEDQETALELIFDDIKDNKPLTHHTVKSWHQLLTRNQATVTVLLADSRGQTQREQRPFTTKGQYKTQSNNPKRRDGIVHEYCPPEHVQAEMDNFLALYQEIRERNLPTHVEAGWLHHRFVRTHPFQDGNGRVSRQLVAYAYLKNDEPSPIITTAQRDNYIDALEIADKGNLKPFCDYLGTLAMLQARTLLNTSINVLSGSRRHVHKNGGITSNGIYYPPDDAGRNDQEHEPWER